MTTPPIETWRLTNWQNKYENVELFRRVREDLTDDDIAELFMALEIIVDSGTFKSDDFGWVSTAKIILEKIRNGNIKDFTQS